MLIYGSQSYHSCLHIRILLNIPKVIAMQHHATTMIRHMTIPILEGCRIQDKESQYRLIDCPEYWKYNFVHYTVGSFQESSRTIPKTKGPTNFSVMV